jgi:Acetyltransferase (isoleucine patch superfamily)
MSGIIDENGNTIHGVAKETGRCATTFKGSNNTLTFGEGVTIENTSIIFNGSNASLHIGDGSKVNAIFLIGDDSQVSVGKGAKFNKPCRLVVQEGVGVKIGDNCLLANVKFRTTDNHSIIDVTSGQRINPAKDIIIGDQVWIAEDVKILKGTEVGNGSIIGAGSIVTSVIPSHSLAVGVPAKVVKKGVTWVDERLPVAEPAVSTPKRSLLGQRQHSPTRIATFGSGLARQVANNYALLFDGKVVSSVCHNRSDYFCNQLLQQQAEPAALTALLEHPFSEDLLNQDREDNILQTLRNQAMETVGLHRLGKGVNFFQAIETSLIDLLVIDNGIDLTARLYHADGKDTEPFLIHPEHFESLTTQQSWTQGELLTPEQSAVGIARLVAHVQQLSPQTRIVFIQAPGHGNATTESYHHAYHTALGSADCSFLPLLGTERPPTSPTQLYATYAGVIKGLELVTH